MSASIPRVVSLVPSATETLRAWGVDPIACSRFCEQPDLPTVGGTKDPDLAAIVELRPDLVVVDREENRREDHDALVAAGLVVHVLHVVDLEHLDAEMAGLASAVGARWSPLGEVPAPPIRGRAWVPIWRRPWMALGEPTYGSAVLRALGLGNVAADDAVAYPELAPDEAAARGTALVVAPSEPYPFAERHRGELAVAGPVRFVDGRDLLWWGVRTSGALDRLAAALDP